MSKDNRFDRIYKQSEFSGHTEILVDKVTGANYIYHGCGYGGGLTPLLDREGKPILSPVTYTNND